MEMGVAVVVAVILAYQLNDINRNLKKIVIVLKEIKGGTAGKQQ